MATRQQQNMKRLEQPHMRDGKNKFYSWSFIRMSAKQTYSQKACEETTEEHLNLSPKDWAQAELR